MVYSLNKYSRISVTLRCAAGKGTVRSLKRVVEFLFLVFGQIRLKSEGGAHGWNGYQNGRIAAQRVWCLVSGARVLD